MFTFIGLNLDDTLDWAEHIKSVRKKASSGCYGLSTAKHFVPLNARLNIYHSLIMSHLLYGNLAYNFKSWRNKSVVRFSKMSLEMSFSALLNFPNKHISRHKTASWGV